MIQLDVTIMGHPYSLLCKDVESETLKQAVKYLDDRMCNIRDAGKVKGNDRIAVMAALGIAAELLASKSTDGPFADMTLAEVKQQVATMHTVLDAALAPQENLF